MKKKYGHVRHMIKLQPHQTKFIDMENPKAILEYQLRNFTCLHEGDTISIQVFKDKFEIDILKITPENEYNAICIIDADVDVDFAPPLDYVEPERPNVQGDLKTEDPKKGGVFGGNGVRIDEKAQTNVRKGSTVPPPNEEEEYDPRRHRIHRGVRKTSIEWTGNGVKISDPVGSKKK
jgi:ubiquitin fusion degradation protein 1